MKTHLGRWVTWRKMRLGRWATTSEARSVFRAFEIGAVVFAIGAFGNELGYRHEERTARAWQALAIPVPGNSAKGEALAYLNSREIALESIDLTPPFLAEQWKQTPEKEREWNKPCLQRTYLREVKLPKATLTSAVLACTDFHEANLQGANLFLTQLQGSILDGADLRDAFLNGANLRGAFLNEADLRDAILDGAQLQGAFFNRAQLQGATLNRADLQGAFLNGA